MDGWSFSLGIVRWPRRSISSSTFEDLFDFGPWKFGFDHIYDIEEDIMLLAEWLI